jgi:hypothetical protein
MATHRKCFLGSIRTYRTRSIKAQVGGVTGKSWGGLRETISPLR